MKGKSVHVVLNAGAGAASKLGVTRQSLMDALGRAGARSVDIDADASTPLADRVRDCQEFCAGGHDDGKERTIAW
ncbi:hypothetical protein, partial [Aureimonas sp. Leaf460]|uniref:hypothetical protein n=2 Tax=unclassified Aureimonas TaxID=2615206 RepID=UPI001AEC3D52